jgi:uncharacterized protein
MNLSSFLIKPASGRCNLACKYCFYRDVAENREIADFGIMTEATARALIEKAFSIDSPAYTFGFQGGEPTLAGIDFFEKFVRIVREVNRKEVPVTYTLQTNATLIDAEWARFLKRENFLVGVSIDGPRAINDTLRISRDGSPSYRRVMTGVQALRDEGVQINVLSVVTALTADNVEVVYNHLRDRGFDWIQFIPCLDPLGEKPGGHPWSLSPAAFSHFLKTTFDLWYAEQINGTPIHIRWFDNLIAMAMGYAPDSCSMLGRCEGYFTVEADGSVYPCDFYVLDEWRLGNVHSTDFAAMAQGETARRFATSSEYIDPQCRTCFAYPLCRGGCRRDREPFVDGKPSLNRYCQAYREFFAYAGDRILQMAHENNILGASANPIF